MSELKSKIDDLLFEIKCSRGNIVFMEAISSRVAENVKALNIMVKTTYESIDIAEKILLELKNETLK